MMTLMSKTDETIIDPRWQSVLTRDKAADGRFVYGVASTGVYCRPSCAARTPRPENVSFHADGGAAQKAGFRACLRCKPDSEAGADRAALVAAACRAIEAADTPPSLDDLARQAGLSPHHFHRVFKAVTGCTPRDYAVAERTRRVREELSGEGSVTDALYGAGFGSNGRFYEASNAMLGMTPGRFRKGGADTEIRFAVAQSSLGPILVAESDVGICAVTLGDDAGALVRELQDRFPQAKLIGGDDAFEVRVAAVVGAVEAPGTGTDLPLDIRGTAFQQRVWQTLRDIPAGQTLSYAEVAERIGAPKAVRAVAGACAANTLAVLIPCHRVVRNDGALSGYRWGVERKRDLLTREKATA